MAKRKQKLEDFDAQLAEVARLMAVEGDEPASPLISLSSEPIDANDCPDSRNQQSMLDVGRRDESAIS